ncbi:MAG: response regulator [Gammaproteobacteria bacterium]|nr:response regulator [Gammaproteobacteria bacterium]
MRENYAQQKQSISNATEPVNASILIVDDMATNRGLVKAVLSPKKYTFYEAESGEKALDMIESSKPDVILLDVMMPGLTGIETCEKIRQKDDFSLVPIIMLTSLDSPDSIADAMTSGATDYIIKPFNAVELQARVKAAINTKRLTDGLDDAESMLFAMARVVEAKDGTTADHCDRLAHISVVLGKALNLEYDDLEALRRGGVLHDIGKIAIPDRILLKPAKLNEDEWKIMRQHPSIGAYLCSALRTMRSTVDIVRCHHEKMNGSGYPEGLAGDEIPYLARIFQITDVFDALTSERPYKKPLPMEKVVEILEDETAKGYWDPDIISTFIDIIKNSPELLTFSKQCQLARDAEIFHNIINAHEIDKEDLS